MTSKPLTVTRQIDAPPSLICKAWTDEASLKQWFGPAGCPISQSSMDFKEGGHYHYGMKVPTGQTMWGRWDFVEIVPEQKLVMLTAFSAEDPQQTTRHPLVPTWPLHTKSTSLFEAKDGGTLLSITWEPHEASAMEIATFNASHDAMKAGWESTFKQLEAFAAQHK